MRTLAFLAVATCGVVGSARCQSDSDTLTSRQRADVLRAMWTQRWILFGNQVRISWCPLVRMAATESDAFLTLPAPLRAHIVGAPPDSCGALGWALGDAATVLLSVVDARTSSAEGAGVPPNLAPPHDTVVVLRVRAYNPQAQESWTEEWVMGLPVNHNVGFIEFRIARLTAT